jgi:hypothetical protein
MSDDRNPALSPKLIEKLLAADLGSIADLFLESRTGIRRIAAGDAGEIEPVVDLPDDGPTPVNPTEPVAGPCDALYLMRVFSRKRHMRQAITFLATDDWRHLAVPIAILPPEYLPDPVIKDFHWWRGAGAETIHSEETARAVARAIVREYDGIKYDPANPGELDVEFEVKTAKGAHTFLTHHGWQGLWCPLYMATEGQDADDRKSMFAKVLGEREISGKGDVKRYARKLARAYDKIKIKPPKLTSHEGPHRCYYVPKGHRRKLREYQRWLDACDPNGCSESRAVCYGIDLAHASMPPEDEWQVVEHPLKTEPEESPSDRADREAVEASARKLPRRQREILEAAMAVARPGDSVSIADLAHRVGIDPTNAHKVVNTLRAKGLWAYKSVRDSESREELAVRKIAGILGKLPGRRAIDRVISESRREVMEAGKIGTRKKS